MWGKKVLGYRNSNVRDLSTPSKAFKQLIQALDTKDEKLFLDVLSPNRQKEFAWWMKKTHWQEIGRKLKNWKDILVMQAEFLSPLKEATLGKEIDTWKSKSNGKEYREFEVLFNEKARPIEPPVIIFEENLDSPQPAWLCDRWLTTQIPMMKATVTVNRTKTKEGKVEIKKVEIKDVKKEYLE